MFNQRAAYDAYNMVQKVIDEVKGEGEVIEGNDWHYVMEGLEGDMLNKSIQLMSMSYEFDAEYARDLMLLLGEMTFIYRDGIRREVMHESILESMKSRIIFIAGGDIRVWVNVYENTRHFGGHEEGGWWYDWMELKEAHNVSFKEAEEKVKVLREEYGEGEGDISSVLGGYEFYFYIEGSRGESQSTERPHYE